VSEQHTVMLCVRERGRDEGLLPGAGQRAPLRERKDELRVRVCERKADLGSCVKRHQKTRDALYLSGRCAFLFIQSR
jgi:hypothetical protein